MNTTLHVERGPLSARRRIAVVLGCGAVLLFALLAPPLVVAQQPPSQPSPPTQTTGQQQPAAEKPKPEEQPAVPPVNYDVVVTAPRMDIPLKDVPAATFVVPEVTLRTMPRGIGAEEVLKTVPGTKVDNQANGERVQLSIRGQGLLTERGVRGIKVLVDGLPLNDPTGFVPDLIDIDWSTATNFSTRGWRTSSRPTAPGGSSCCRSGTCSASTTSRLRNPTRTGTRTSRGRRASSSWARACGSASSSWTL